MQSLRTATTLARLVLVWFTLALGVAIASPLVNPKAMELVCSGSGAMKLIVKSDDGSGGSAQVGSHTLDCSLCATPGAPPPAVVTLPIAPSALAYATQSIPSARIAALTAAPLPARGPPKL